MKSRDKENINIAFCFNDTKNKRYLIYTITTIVQMLSKTTSRYFYNIFILTDSKNAFLIKMCVKEIINLSNYEIKIIRPTYSFSNVNISQPNLSNATYWRLLLPKILKCIKIAYFDCDVIFNEDPAVFYNLNIDNYDVAGVYDHGILVKTIKSFYIDKTQKQLENYICAGVLLMNLKKLRKKTNFLISKTKNQYKMHDQDIINFYTNKKILPYFYGGCSFCWRTAKLTYDKLHTTKSNIISQFKNIKILHCTIPKPWYNLSSFYNLGWSIYLLIQKIHYFFTNNTFFKLFYEWHKFYKIVKRKIYKLKSS